MHQHPWQGACPAQWGGGEKLRMPASTIHYGDRRLLGEYPALWNSLALMHARHHGVLPSFVACSCQ